jgi:hypothetical protein
MDLQVNLAEYRRGLVQDAIGRAGVEWQLERVELELEQLDLRHADLRIRDAARRRRLVASLAEHGQQVAVVVVAEDGRYVLIDGYARVDALSRIGEDVVRATAWPVTESEALLHRHHLSASSRSALEEAWLLERLREQGLGQEELAQRLCRSKSWVSRRLALLSELSTMAQARVRAGTIGPHAAMKYLVPLARANRAQCESLIAALGEMRVTDRDLSVLYDGWRRADPHGRERLVADPALFLRAMRAQSARQGESETNEGLLKDLTTLSAVAWRARQRIVRDGLGVAAVYQHLDVGGAWRSAESAIEALRAAWKEVWPHVGPEHEDGHPEAA